MSKKKVITLILSAMLIVLVSGGCSSENNMTTSETTQESTTESSSLSNSSSSSSDSSSSSSSSSSKVSTNYTGIATEIIRYIKNGNYDTAASMLNSYSGLDLDDYSSVLIEFKLAVLETAPNNSQSTSKLDTVLENIQSLKDLYSAVSKKTSEDLSDYQNLLSLRKETAELMKKTNSYEKLMKSSHYTNINNMRTTMSNNLGNGSVLYQYIELGKQYLKSLEDSDIRDGNEYVQEYININYDFLNYIVDYYNDRFVYNNSSAASTDLDYAKNNITEFAQHGNNIISLLEKAKNLAQQELDLVERLQQENHR